MSPDPRLTCALGLMDPVIGCGLATPLEDIFCNMQEVRQMVSEIVLDPAAAPADPTALAALITALASLSSASTIRT